MHLTFVLHLTVFTIPLLIYDLTATRVMVWFCLFDIQCRILQHIPKNVLKYVFIYRTGNEFGKAANHRFKNQLGPDLGPQKGVGCV